MAAAAKTVKDVPSHDFVRAYAAHLKRTGKLRFHSADTVYYSPHWGQIEVPSWGDLVKTAAFKELAPYDADWFYIRAASMARKIYLRQGIGVGAFKKIYGGRKRRGSKPSHFAKSSGSIARHVLQQLERIKIVELDTKGGRRITSDGQRDLDRIAGRVTVPPANWGTTVPTSDAPPPAES
eukprot:SM000044S16043  [mRNA]  locus=s44:791545:792884:+ [translate_table: standard]